MEGNKKAPVREQIRVYNNIDETEKFEHCMENYLLCQSKTADIRQKSYTAFMVFVITEIVSIAVIIGAILTLLIYAH